VRRMTTVLCLALLFAGVSSAQPQTLTQSVDNTTITLGNTVACAGTTTGFHALNSYFRLYDLSTILTLPGAIDVTCIRYGVEAATAGPTQVPAATQPVEIRLYRDNGNVFPAGIPTTPVHTEVFRQADVAVPGQIFVRGMSQLVTFQPTDRLLVEFFMPDGAATMDTLFIASNGAGETAPGYLVAPGCGAAVPTTFATLMFPNVHIILDVNFVASGMPPAPVLSVQIGAADPMTGNTDFTVTNDGLIAGREIWNFYSFSACPGGIGTGPYLGLCFNNINDLLLQLATPPNTPPLRYIATECSQTFGPLALPTGLNFDVITLDFNATTGVINGFSNVVLINH
jgi:hypothetical protein